MSLEANMCYLLGNMAKEAKLTLLNPSLSEKSRFLIIFSKATAHNFKVSKLKD